jgi:hypothetical protein
MSLTNVDLPEPETPVTATKADSGNETSIFCRLFSLAALTVITFLSSIALRFLGISITLLPAK